MFVLSVEGAGYVDRGLWCTHKILGVFATRELALQHEACQEVHEEDIVILTDAETGDRERICDALD